MADPYDPTNSNDEQPYAQEPLEVEDAPRRAASARFVVDSQVGAEAAMRDAMDPANQSLADALRLSYRVLQFVILVLIVLFLASGFHTIGEDESGVATRWGRIVPLGDELELSSGPKFNVLPYPAGDFVTVKVQNRRADVGRTFMPATQRGRNREDMVEAATFAQALHPGRDGSVLMRDADLAHMEVNASYEIEKPVEFLKSVSDTEQRRDASRMVTLALQRAAIHVAAGMTLDELIEPAFNDHTRERIAQHAQQALDQLDCGIRITQVTVQGSPPLFIERTMGELQQSIAAATITVQSAWKEWEKTLTTVAGIGHAMLTKLIDEYEDALDRDDAAAAEQIRTAINEALESDAVTGEVVDIIHYAKAYRSLVDQTLGKDLRVFRSLLDTFRQNPRLVVRQQLLEMFTQVTGRHDAEIIQVPHPLGKFAMSISGSAAIQELRQKMDVERRRNQAYATGADLTMPPILRRTQIFDKGPGRQLEIKDGKLTNLGEQK